MVRIAAGKEKAIYENGLEVDAVISHIESSWHDGHKYFNAYATYMDENGTAHEAALNIRTEFPIGRKLRIKYMPDNYGYAVFVSQELNN